ncbi:MAG: RdgB/HAM1 family non-canonical purine NTP pyrophosphatase [Candidatus Omnitrophota bacterium]
MKTLTIATTNENKKRELKRLLCNANVKVLTIADWKIHPPNIVEDGKTFRQNAVKKALTFSTLLGGLVLADDSGIMVNAIFGRPGVRSARFARAKATDKENNLKLLKLMEKIPQKNRQATFVCVVALAENGKLLGTAEGECKGTIGFKPEGKNGFGYDPLFTPRGKTRTFAQYEETFKNKISHRGVALKKAKSIILKYL